jgi:ubiquinone/menaquinone biosynthesis C-methylase UbiE
MTTSLEGLQGQAVRAGYRAAHTGLAVGLGLTLRMITRTLSPETIRRPEPDELKVIVERFRALLDRDLANVEAGWYPRELLFQFPLGHYARRFPKSLMEMPAIAKRRREKRFRDLPTVPEHRYPKYYLRNFHWQTDGWLSRHSAEMYDLEVEILFGGTADIMRRMAIPPLVRHLRDAAAPRVLDVGCGTGRFMLQLSRALPSARLTGLDLSPFYLKEAARTLESVPDVSLVSGNAESMEWRDGSFEAASSVFLFHELPRRVRRNVVNEVFRCLAPGAVFVVCDSAQLNDSPEIQPALEGFPQAYHEPFYADYIKDPLEDVLTQGGFEVLDSEAFSVSKVVTARKPG